MWRALAALAALLLLGAARAPGGVALDVLLAKADEEPTALR
jgi:hypothetical protein